MISTSLATSVVNAFELALPPPRAGGYGTVRPGVGLHTSGRATRAAGVSGHIAEHKIQQTVEPRAADLLNKPNHTLLDVVSVGQRKIVQRAERLDPLVDGAGGDQTRERANGSRLDNLRSRLFGRRDVPQRPSRPLQIDVVGVGARR
eukprot:3094328-Prymnesium_polylepis.2